MEPATTALRIRKVRELVIVAKLAEGTGRAELRGAASLRAEACGLLYRIARDIDEFGRSPKTIERLKELERGQAEMAKRTYGSGPNSRHTA